MSVYYIGNIPYDTNYLEHHGILGMKWGVRRYQNEDGSYTSAGRRRYGIGAIGDSIAGTIKNHARDRALSKEFGRTIKNYDRIHDMRTHNTLKDRAKRALGNAVSAAKSGAREAGETARAYGDSARLAGVSARLKISGSFWRTAENAEKVKQGAGILAKALGRAGSTSMSAVLGGNKYTRSGASAVDKIFGLSDKAKKKFQEEAFNIRKNKIKQEMSDRYDRAQGWMRSGGTTRIWARTQGVPYSNRFLDDYERRHYGS